ncbi:MAG: hypothetical protein LBT09_12880 [Planctomycetaceae bacterium]|jgi:hypothetical protein|nr:hypothetical protein [Planctomycetaceae bacterium]
MPADVFWQCRGEKEEWRYIIFGYGWVLFFEYIKKRESDFYGVYWFYRMICV